MEPIETKRAVEEFLDMVANALHGNGRLQISERLKFRQAVADLNISPTVATETIKRLTYKQYCRGPWPDRDHTGALVCEFGEIVDGIEVYIKLKVIEKYGFTYCQCISFHRAEAPLEFPLKGGDVGD